MLELVFENAGLSIEGENPFYANATMESLTILNNMADGIATGVVRYSELLPECTIGEFLDTLWARFGLVYNADFNAGTVKLRLLRDILRNSEFKDLDEYIAGHLKITHNTPQYIKMTANTSFDSAEPYYERFEDFCRYGSTPAQLEFVFSGSEPKTSSWIGIPKKSYDADGKEHIEYKEVKTSAFENWDPQPEGMEAFELSGVDECVPVEQVQMYRNHKVVFNEYLPIYMAGARHLHTTIKNGDSEEEISPGPLAFAFACIYDGDQSFTPEYVGNEDEGYDYRGQVTPRVNWVTLPDGSLPDFGLPYQGRDGLYATFWADFDRSLRRSNRTIEVPLRVPMQEIAGTDVSGLYRFRNVACMLDSLSYSIPGKSPLAVTAKLRTLLPADDSDEFWEKDAIPVYWAYKNRVEDND